MFCSSSPRKCFKVKKNIFSTISKNVFKTSSKLSPMLSWGAQTLALTTFVPTLLDGALVSLSFCHYKSS
jgi:hypothetical protein